MILVEKELNSFSDENKIVATPYTTIIKENYADLVDQIQKIIDDNQIEGIVVGNPVNMDGTEGPSSQSAKDLAKKSFKRYYRKYHFMG